MMTIQYLAGPPIGWHVGMPWVRPSTRRGGKLEPIPPRVIQMDGDELDHVRGLVRAHYQTSPEEMPRWALPGSSQVSAHLVDAVEALLIVSLIESYLAATYDVWEAARREQELNPFALAKNEMMGCPQCGPWPEVRFLERPGKGMLCRRCLRPIEHRTITGDPSSKAWHFGTPTEPREDDVYAVLKELLDAGSVHDWSARIDPQRYAAAEQRARLILPTTTEATS